jgi:rare lipoprotein A
MAIVGKVSFYGKNSKAEHLNKDTASTEKFDPNGKTIALPDRPKEGIKGFGKMYKVTNLENDKSVIVKHNDVGPAKKLDRIGDLSYSAFKDIADEKTGVIKARIEEYNPQEAALETELLRQAKK